MAQLNDYGKAGLIGVLTPQANTTVEPELWALMPPGWSLLNARLTSDLATIEARLVDYTTKFAETAERFANAPIDAVAVACTGASYLIGAEAEDRIVGEMEDRFGCPCLTAAIASVAALKAMGAKRIGLLSPYPDSLNARSTAYWQARGFEVVEKQGPELEADAFHPIYAMPGAGVLRAYERLSQANIDAILMLGTGMATLGPILAGADRGLSPAVSCNAALAWACCRAVDAAHADISHWTTAPHWRDRATTLFPNLAD